MGSATTNPTWNVERTSGSKIRVTFRGHVDPEMGQLSAARVLELMDEGPVHLVLDLEGVEGYSKHARKSWQTTLWPKRRQILSLTVTTSSQLTKMGATMFGAFLDVPCEIVDQNG